MPFIYFDPTKVFESCKDLKVPIEIPTTDDYAWEFFRKYNWVCNKMMIAESQGIDCGPCGSYPEKYPVILKPIYNLFSGGVESEIIYSEEEYQEKYIKKCKSPGLMWMEYFSGEHLSHDFVLVNGEIKNCICFKGYPSTMGMFDYWEIIECEIPDEWVETHLVGYTGAVNIETIGGNIIECHLRMGDSKRIGHRGYLEAIINLYATGNWEFKDKIPKLYLLPVFGEHDKEYSIEGAEEICREAYAWQVFDSEWHLRPPGGKRLALIVVDDYEKGIRIRQELSKNSNPICKG